MKRVVTHATLYAMKIGILQTGQAPRELQREHGDFVDMFQSMFSTQDFTFRHYAVCEQEFPTSVDEAEGWLVTGSKCGAYEDHAWIPPLEEFLRAAYREEVPVVGICFGHQIFAQAMGGKVEKSQSGWQVGMQNYDLTELQAANLTKTSCVPAWHQDQVVSKPDIAEVLGHSSHCRYAVLGYEGRALTLQPHPEFTKPFLKDLIAFRKNILDSSVIERAQESLSRNSDALAIAEHLAAFYRRRAPKQDASKRLA